MTDQQAYWTEKGATKNFTTPLNLELFTAHVPRDARILDFGCGYGRTLAELQGAGYDALTGIDFSEPLIRRGLDENPTLDLQAYPGGPLPYEDDSFDAALMLAVFTCMPETRTQAETLLEIKRVLRPGGLLYVTDFCSTATAETWTATRPARRNTPSTASSRSRTAASCATTTSTTCRPSSSTSKPSPSKRPSSPPCTATSRAPSTECSACPPREDASGGPFGETRALPWTRLRPRALRIPWAHARVRAGKEGECVLAWGLAG